MMLMGPPAALCGAMVANAKARNGGAGPAGGVRWAAALAAAHGWAGGPRGGLGDGDWMLWKVRVKSRRIKQIFQGFRMSYASCCTCRVGSACAKSDCTRDWLCCPY